MNIRTLASRSEGRVRGEDYYEHVEIRARLGET